MIFDVIIGVLENYYVVNRSYFLTDLIVSVVYKHKSYLSNVGFFSELILVLKIQLPDIAKKSNFRVNYVTKKVRTSVTVSINLNFLNKAAEVNLHHTVNIPLKFQTAFETSKDIFQGITPPPAPSSKHKGLKNFSYHSLIKFRFCDISSSTA